MDGQAHMAAALARLLRQESEGARLKIDIRPKQVCQVANAAPGVEPQEDEPAPLDIRRGGEDALHLLRREGLLLDGLACDAIDTGGGVVRDEPALACGLEG